MKDPRYRRLLPVILIIAIALIAATALTVSRASKVPISNFDYTTLLMQLESGQIKTVFIDGAQVSGELIDGRHFFSDLPNLDAQVAVADKLAARNIPVRFTAPGSIDTVQVISSVVLLFAIAGVFYIVIRKSPGGINQNQKRPVRAERTQVKFNDVAGVDEAKQELEEIVEFLRKPERFTRLGGRIPRGVLLTGPPGTGKTLLARAVAGEAGVPFFSISGSEFVEMFVGVGARRVRDLFAQGRKVAPCIIFIDEIDAIGRHRGGAASSHNEEREQALNQLLVEMDGFDATLGIVVVAASNRPDILDSALLRPGRFDRRVTVDRPDIRGRRAILAVHTRKTPLAKDIDLHRIARGTPGFSGAELANLVNEAVLSAARQGREQITMDDFEKARDKVLMGAERSSVVISEQERAAIAVHEAGHALVALHVPGSDPIHKISIIPRGMALGVTLQLPEGDRFIHSREYLESQIAILMGGRLAEELMLGAFGSGSANDIERATAIARKMVRQLGMSRLGPIVCLERGPHGPHRDFLSEYSPRTEERIDEEVEMIINTQMKRAREILSRERMALERLRDALLEEETIDGEDFLAIVATSAQGSLTQYKPRRRKNDISVENIRSLS
ncbi:MAG: ATP-dependent zinc metalloprotease FtsH [Acidobacteriota bacterium]